jgi:hypothetical protein
MMCQQTFVQFPNIKLHEKWLQQFRAITCRQPEQLQRALKQGPVARLTQTGVALAFLNTNSSDMLHAV